MRKMPDGTRFVILDGASGTMLQERGLKAGERPDIMNITAPDKVLEVQRMYAQAGSEIIYTNTFGSNSHALKKTGYTAAEVITAAVGITKRACNGAAKTALDIGPLGDFVEPLGGLSFESAYEMFKEQAVSGESAGADLAVIETMSDLMELKAAICAVRENTKLPVFATMTFNKNGRTFAGCTAESFAVTAERLGAQAIGLNCSLEPSQMYPVAERIAQNTTLPLIVKPNAGLPDGETGLYKTSAEEFAKEMAEYAKIGVRYVGGCCGTTPEFIREIRRVFTELTPITPKTRLLPQICSASKTMPCDTIKITRKMESFVNYDVELEKIYAQAEDDNEVVEIIIPEDETESTRLIAAAREITDKPQALISSGNENALKNALREVCGIAAVVLKSARTEKLENIAKSYGAIIFD